MLVASDFAWMRQACCYSSQGYSQVAQSDLGHELALLSRVVSANRQQHRRAHYYQRLRIVLKRVSQAHESCGGAAVGRGTHLECLHSAAAMAHPVRRRDGARVLRCAATGALAQCCGRTCAPEV